MIPFQHGAFGVAGYASDFELIETQTVGAGGQASITFSSIPQTYKHLQIHGIARTNRSAVSDWIVVNYNADSGTNYSNHYLLGTGSTASSGAATSNTFADWERLAGATSGANIFGAVMADILDYTNTSKNKTDRVFGGWDNNGSGEIYLRSNAWLSTSAITSIKLSPGAGTAFVQFSSFSLYGMK